MKPYPSTVTSMSKERLRRAWGGLLPLEETSRLDDLICNRIHERVSAELAASFPGGRHPQNVSVRRLREDIVELQAKVEALVSKPIWRLSRLTRMVEDLSPDETTVKRAKVLLERLHAAAKEVGPVPAPQIEQADDDLEISWFDLEARTQLTFCIDPCEVSLSMTRYPSDGDPEELTEPTNADLKAGLQWVMSL